MKKALLVVLIVLLIPIKADAVCRGERPNIINWDEQGFEKIKTTAYCVGHHTANGSKVHEGGCAASSEHMGDVAILYTLDGEYLGMYEVNDAGGTDAIRQGYVIDVYFENYTRCKDYMALTEGSVYVKWVKGVG